MTKYTKGWDFHLVNVPVYLKLCYQTQAKFICRCLQRQESWGSQNALGLRYLALLYVHVLWTTGLW
jgi:hypothetical protein